MGWPRLAPQRERDGWVAPHRADLSTVRPGGKGRSGVACLSRSEFFDGACDVLGFGHGEGMLALVFDDGVA